MPLFGKTGAKARDFFSSPVGQQVLAWGSQMDPGDPTASSGPTRRAWAGRQGSSRPSAT